MDATADPDELRRELARLTALSEATERRLRATYAVSRVLGEESSVETAMPRILGALGTALACKLAGYWLAEGDALRFRTVWTASAEDGAAWEAICRANAISPGVGLPGRVWRDRGPAWLHDLSEDHGLPRLPALRARGIKSGMGFPVAVGADVFGVIELFTDRAEPPDDQLIEVLRTIGLHLGQFVEHLRTQQQLRAEVEQRETVVRELEQERQALALINEVGRSIAVELDQDTLVQSVTDAATKLTGAQFGACFYNVTEGGDAYSLYTLSGVSRDAFAKFPMPRKTGIFAPTFEGRGPLRLDDVTKDVRYGKNSPYKGMPEGHLPVRSYLAVPVVSRSGVVIGGLLFGHAEPGVFSERSQRIAVGLAAHAATALDNARLYANAQRLIGELEKTNLELDQFAYATSHDLRAPLRGISNLTAWIEEDLGKPIPKKINEHLQMLKGRAARMDKLINGLLELARVGRTRQKSERVDVTELLHETIDLLAPDPKARILIIGAMPTMVCERFALQQVFMNLIANALQHAGRTDVGVRITASESASEVEFAIADNGVGIPAEHHDRVWQMFQTLQSRDVHDTTGIGLAIVRKQVETNGGRAWIDTTTTTGTTVRFTWSKRSK